MSGKQDTSLPGKSFYYNRCLKCFYLRIELEHWYCVHFKKKCENIPECAYEYNFVIMKRKKEGW